MIDDPPERAAAARVKELALEVGFDLVGIAGPSLPEAFARYEAAIANGYGADLPWLVDAPELRRDARNVWPEARSVIVVALSYASPDVPGYLEAPPGPDEGWIARYAQGRDYHLLMKQKLVQLARKLEEEPEVDYHPSTSHRVFVDTGPVLEKAFAQAAGLGWIGKNTLLVRPRAPDDPVGPGSWLFLGVVLTPLALEPDAPETDHCGTCTRCLDVCPTDAFPAPYVLDARRCIATWTIESPSPAAVIDPATLGRHLFGCDLCQEVCPYNRHARPTRHAALRPRPENVRPRLDGLELTDEATFRARFKRSAVRRVTAAQMRETVAVLRRDRQGP
ncbi:MAG: tRNA epoxyqueuosine(34) reductase QueG [Deltaproteobacteria bacterium]|nr:tRNA epoxyqueuosine(34) reductase QueG [Deltaproteobacteria bacterium]